MEKVKKNPHKHLIPMLALSCCLFHSVTCKTATPQEDRQAQEKKRIAAAAAQQKQDLQKWREQVQKIYSGYKKFNADFTIKGVVANREIYYEGSLSASSNMQNQDIRITLRDPIFKSNLFSLVIKGNQLEEINYLQDTRNKYDLDQYRWVEVFGRVFPLKFFIPMMIGFPPVEFFNDGAELQENGAKIYFKDTDYECIGKFKDYKLESIHFRGDGEREVISILFMGDKKLKNNRVFPQMLHINRSRSEKDFLRMNFSYVQIN